MSEWKEVKLGMLGNIITGKTPRTAIEDNYGGTIPFLTPSDDMSVKHVVFTKKTLSEKGVAEVKNCLLPCGAVCVSCIGSDLGKVVITTGDTITNQQINSIIVNENNNNDFVYYLLTIVGRELNRISKTSTAVPIINKSTFSSYEIKIPDLFTQQEIAGILSSLDAKIETNNKLNEKLEEMAQAIFKSWFVDFEPFKDKPFHETELGMIPEGWEVVSLTDIATFTNGLAMQKFRPNYKEPHLPVLKIKELRQGFCDDSSEICIDDISDDFIADDGDIIFSWSGTLLVDIWCGGKCGVNQHLFKVTSEKYNKWFFYFWIKRHLAEFIRIAKDKAVTMGHIKRGHLTNALVVVPNEKTMQNADKIFTPIIDRIIEAKI